jgi:hypothetical protein
MTRVGRRRIGLAGLAVLFAAGCDDGGGTDAGREDGRGDDVVVDDAVADDVEAPVDASDDFAEPDEGPEDAGTEVDAVEADVVEEADAPPAEDAPGAEDTADAGDGDEADGEPHPFEGILCGWGICFGSEVCCVQASPPAEECTAPDGCAGDLVLTCDGPEDCGPGEQCCMPSGAVSRTTCMASCVSGFPLCHAVGECDDGDGGTFDYCRVAVCAYPELGRGMYCIHTRNEQCEDGIDNDGDTVIDVADSDCASFPC